MGGLSAKDEFQLEENLFYFICELDSFQSLKEEEKLMVEKTTTK